MARKVETWRHVGLVLCITLVVVGLRLLYADAYLHERKRLQAQAKRQHFASIVRSWNKRALIPLEEAVPGTVPLVIHSGGIVLSQEQTAKIQDAAYGLLSYYRRPTFDGFVSFYTRLGESSGIAIGGGLSRQVEILKLKKGMKFPECPTNSVKLLWEFNHLDQLTKEPNSIVGLGTNGIKVYISSGLSSNGTVHARAAKLCTVMYEAPNSGFVYHDTPQRIYHLGQSNIFADIYFLGKASYSSNTGPLVFSYFWSPKCTNWLPFKAYCDAHLGLTMMF
jgi:hypothetical protein